MDQVPKTLDPTIPMMQVKILIMSLIVEKKKCPLKSKKFSVEFSTYFYLETETRNNRRSLQVDLRTVACKLLLPARLS